MLSKSVVLLLNADRLHPLTMAEIRRRADNYAKALGEAYLTACIVYGSAESRAKWVEMASKLGPKYLAFSYQDASCAEHADTLLANDARQLVADGVRHFFFGSMSPELNTVQEELTSQGVEVFGRPNSIPGGVLTAAAKRNLAEYLQETLDRAFPGELAPAPLGWVEMDLMSELGIYSPEMVGCKSFEEFLSSLPAVKLTSHTITPSAKEKRRNPEAASKTSRNVSVDDSHLRIEPAELIFATPLGTEYLTLRAVELLEDELKPLDWPNLVVAFMRATIEAGWIREDQLDEITEASESQIESFKLSLKARPLFKELVVQLDAHTA